MGRGVNPVWSCGLTFPAQENSGGLSAWSSEAISWWEEEVTWAWEAENAKLWVLSVWRRAHGPALGVAGGGWCSRGPGQAWRHCGGRGLAAVRLVGL